MPEYGSASAMFKGIAKRAEALGLIANGTAAQSAASMQTRAVIAKARHTSRQAPANKR